MEILWLMSGNLFYLRNPVFLLHFSSFYNIVVLSGLEKVLLYSDLVPDILYQYRLSLENLAKSCITLKTIMEN